MTADQPATQGPGEMDDRVARMNEAFWPYFYASADACTAATIPGLVRALNSKTSYAVARALGELMRTHPNDEAITALLDWLPVQASMYPDVLEALLKAGDPVLPLLRQRLAQWSAQDDDEAIRHALDFASRLPISGRLQILPDWYRLLHHDHPMIRWGAIFEGREFVLISMVAGADSVPFSVVVERLRELALHDPDPDVREEAAACLAEFPIPNEQIRPVPAAHCD